MKRKDQAHIKKIASIKIVPNKLKAKIGFLPLLSLKAPQYPAVKAESIPIIKVKIVACSKRTHN